MGQGIQENTPQKHKQYPMKNAREVYTVQLPEKAA